MLRSSLPQPAFVASRLPHVLRRRKTVAMVARAAPRTIWVKGDPENKVLGDCPFCHRALLTLELKGLEYDKDYIDFANKPDWLFKYSERGTVPIMKDGDTMVPDSGDICEYLEKEYPEPALGAPETPVAAKLLPAFVGLLKASDDEAGEKEAALTEQLDELEAHLAQGGPFICGERMGAADALVFPRIYHLTVALPEFRGWTLPEKYTAIQQYVADVKATSAFKNTFYGEDIIIAGWGSHDGVTKKV